MQGRRPLSRRHAQIPRPPPDIIGDEASPGGGARDDTGGDHSLVGPLHVIPKEPPLRLLTVRIRRKGTVVRARERQQNGARSSIYSEFACSSGLGYARIMSASRAGILPPPPPTPI